MDTGRRLNACGLAHEGLEPLQTVANASEDESKRSGVRSHQLGNATRLVPVGDIDICILVDEAAMSRTKDG